MFYENSVFIRLLPYIYIALSVGLHFCLYHSLIMHYCWDEMSRTTNTIVDAQKRNSKHPLVFLNIPYCFGYHYCIKAESFGKSASPSFHYREPCGRKYTRIQPNSMGFFLLWVRDVPHPYFLFPYFPHTSKFLASKTILIWPGCVWALVFHGKPEKKSRKTF